LTATRGEEWVALLNRCGDRWRECTPVDGQVHGDTIRLGDEVLTRGGDGRWTTPRALLGYCPHCGGQVRLCDVLMPEADDPDVLTACSGCAADVWDADLRTSPPEEKRCDARG
jgi:hypothetical protein